ncbi:MAG: 4-hydroxy-tetrahydrodipicolinate synthase, partial [Acidimicrobiia bacterium]|nr:4-hydroxy-tetrahydrodipicolinate synthase [Acidimicrobiia bacterium]
MPRFGQVVTAMVTPFHKDGSLNLDGAKRLARWLQDNGNDGLVIAGTTGEAPVLTDDERLSLFKAVVEAVTIPVIAGTGTNDTAHSIHLTKEATKLGVAGILAVTPYYNRPSQAGIDAHMRAVCGSTNLPVVIYDIPVRTGRKINTSTLAKLANDVKNVAGVKDAAGNPAESARLMTMVPKSFELISGDDGLTLPLMAVGCTAVIGVATHWSGVDHQEMFKKWNAGDTAGARAVNARLVESFTFETGDDNPNPLPTKAMMNHLGLDVGDARLPMGPPPAGLA